LRISFWDTLASLVNRFQSFQKNEIPYH